MIHAGPALLSETKSFKPDNTVATWIFFLFKKNTHTHGLDHQSIGHRNVLTHFFYHRRSHDKDFDYI